MAIDVQRRPDISAGQRSADTGGQVIYAIGDVHGRYDLLVALLQGIAEDVAKSAPANHLLLFLGDYVDRGPSSAEVLTTLIWLSRHAEFDVTFLRGNHEEMLLAFLHRPEEAAAWLKFGGTETLRAYGVKVTGEESPDTYWRLRDEFMDRFPASHLEFLHALETKVVHGDYVFVHAGLRPDVPIARQSYDDIIWIRDEFLKAEKPFEKIVVHGHSWTSDVPVCTATRIGVDTGAYRTGALTTVRLGVPAIEVIQARAMGDAGPNLTDHRLADDHIDQTIVKQRPTAG